MTAQWRGLLIIVCLELIGAGTLAVRALGRAPAPLPDLSRFDPETAADLRRLHADLNERDAASWQRLAEVYLPFGCLPESELCFRRAAALDPQSGQILYGWASCLDRLGQLAESTDRYERAAARAPDNYAQSCYYRIGRNYLREENVAAADAALTRAGDLPQALFLRARMSLRSGNLPEASQLLEVLQQQMPAGVQTIQLQAELELAQGRSDRAAAAFHRLDRVEERFDLNDQNVLYASVEAQHGFLRKLNLCSGGGDPGSEAECVLAAIAGHPQEYIYLPKVAELQMKAGRPEQALPLLQQAIQEGRLSPGLLEQLGDVFTALQRDEEAHTHWLQAASLGETATVHGKLAESFRARNDEAAALRHAARQREAEGVAAYRKDALDSAISILEDAVTLNPSAARAWFYLGEAYYASGDHSKARVAYQNCLNENPDHGRALAAMKRLLPAASD